MPRLDRFPFSRSLSMESTRKFRAPSTCCCKTPSRRSFEAAKTNLCDRFDDHPHKRSGQLESMENHYCSSITADSSSAFSMGSPFFIFQRWTSCCFQGGGCPCPFSSSTGNKYCFRTRELEDMSVRNETRKKKKKKVEAFQKKEPLSERAAAAQRVPIALVFKTEKPKEDGKFIWANKYQPKYLRDFICHREPAQLLLSLVSSGESSHCILEGPPGLGKRTLALALLREDLGTAGMETKEEVKEFNIEEGPVSGIQMNAQVSSKHIEVDLSELNGYAVHVVVELIKETHRLFNHADKNNKLAIILYGAGILSINDQLQIRSCLENHKGNYKVYFCSSGVSKLRNIESLCTLIQILPPSKDQIIEVLEFIANCEGIELPPRLAENIAVSSKHSIQQAIRSFEATWRLNYPFKEDQMIMTGWEEELAVIANCVIDEQSPKQLYIIREKLKTFMVHNVSPEIVYKSLMEELNKLLNHSFQVIITKLGQDGGLIDQDLTSTQNKFEGRSIQEPVLKRKAVLFLKIEPVKRNAVLFLKLEECIAKFMSIYKIVSQKEQQMRDEIRYAPV